MYIFFWYKILFTKNVHNYNSKFDLVYFRMQDALNTEFLNTVYLDYHRTKVLIHLISAMLPKTLLVLISFMDVSEKDPRIINIGKNGAFSLREKGPTHQP